MHAHMHYSICTHTDDTNTQLRLSTNGLGNVANQRSIVSEASQVFHHVTVAVNTADAEQYEEMMHPDLTMRGESQTLRPISAYYTPTTVPPQQLQKALDQVTAFTRECVQVREKKTIMMMTITYIYTSLCHVHLSSMPR